MVISRKFIRRIKLYPERQYVLARKANILPSTLSKIINEIDPIKKGDLRVVKVGKILGLSPNECFKEQTEEGGSK